MNIGHLTLAQGVITTSASGQELLFRLCLRLRMRHYVWSRVLPGNADIAWTRRTSRPPPLARGRI